jgi:predicted RNase H-like HicB family nuclease
MSKRVDPTITLTERDGYWVAIHEPTGVGAQGETRDEALDELDEAVALYTDDSTDSLDDGGESSRDTEADEIWRDATAETKRRFEAEDVTEEDVEDAIERARSQ